MMKLSQYIAQAGICSRRQAMDLILAGGGRIMVDGVSATNNVNIVPDQNVVTLDNKKLVLPSNRLWSYYKPLGEVVTQSDTGGRTTVFDSLERLYNKSLPPTLKAVGRLDINSEGLLLITNIGEIAYFLEHPDNCIPRQYRVRASGGMVTERQRQWLAAGPRIDGIQYRPIQIHQISTASQVSLAPGLRGAIRSTSSRDGEYDGERRKNNWFEVTVTEGKFREIRKIFDELGFSVSRLIRTGFGNWRLGSMKPQDLVEEEWTEEMQRAKESFCSRARAIRQQQSDSVNNAKPSVDPPTTFNVKSYHITSSPPLRRIPNHAAPTLTDDSELEDEDVEFDEDFEDDTSPPTAPTKLHRAMRESEVQHLKALPAGVDFIPVPFDDFFDTPQSNAESVQSSSSSPQSSILRPHRSPSFFPRSNHSDRSPPRTSRSRRTPS